MEAPLTQQTALLNTKIHQMKDLSARVEAAEAATAKAVSQNVGSTVAGTQSWGHFENGVPNVAGNLFPTRPVTLELDTPQMYERYIDTTYATLSK
ncbi:hypothetical protein CYMTET_11689 [Cymbomonas tetramitiformis]|uniref:Uncharacterized protein n=1 Tax=Cymbomonas tetramitiformis TaxID=36881 RepID=A0AAE0BEP7_9CHLO|nr:hypothetical protein CYMTET_54540 [Cymbomonas tetramitiformis]KAK3280465.1 hypothetical protein CYMTET_11689 [Cymbomonas tetramitiformis]